MQDGNYSKQQMADELLQSSDVCTGTVDDLHVVDDQPDQFLELRENLKIPYASTYSISNSDSDNSMAPFISRLHFSHSSFGFQPVARAALKVHDTQRGRRLISPASVLAFEACVSAAQSHGSAQGKSPKLPLSKERSKEYHLVECVRSQPRLAYSSRAERGITINQPIEMTSWCRPQKSQSFESFGSVKESSSRGSEDVLYVLPEGETVGPYYDSITEQSPESDSLEDEFILIRECEGSSAQSRTGSSIYSLQNANTSRFSMHRLPLLMSCINQNNLLTDVNLDKSDDDSCFSVPRQKLHQDVSGVLVEKIPKPDAKPSAATSVDSKALPLASDQFCFSDLPNFAARNWTLFKTTDSSKTTSSKQHLGDQQVNNLTDCNQRNSQAASYLSIKSDSVDIKTNAKADLGQMLANEHLPIQISMKDPVHHKLDDNIKRITDELDGVLREIAIRKNCLSQQPHSPHNQHGSIRSSIHSPQTSLETSPDDTSQNKVASNWDLVRVKKAVQNYPESGCREAHGFVWPNKKPHIQHMANITRGSQKYRVRSKHTVHHKAPHAWEQYGYHTHPYCDYFHQKLVSDERWPESLRASSRGHPLQLPCGQPPNQRFKRMIAKRRKGTLETVQPVDPKLSIHQHSDIKDSCLLSDGASPTQSAMDLAVRVLHIPIFRCTSMYAVAPITSDSSKSVPKVQKDSILTIIAPQSTDVTMMPCTREKWRSFPSKSQKRSKWASAYYAIKRNEHSARIRQKLHGQIPSTDVNDALPNLHDDDKQNACRTSLPTHHLEGMQESELSPNGSTDHSFQKVNQNNNALLEKPLPNLSQLSTPEKSCTNEKLASPLSKKSDSHTALDPSDVGKNVELLSSNSSKLNSVYTTARSSLSPASAMVITATRKNWTPYYTNLNGHGSKHQPSAHIERISSGEFENASASEELTQTSSEMLTEKDTKFGNSSESKADQPSAGMLSSAPSLRHNSMTASSQEKSVHHGEQSSPQPADSWWLHDDWTDLDGSKATSPHSASQHDDASSFMNTAFAEGHQCTGYVTADQRSTDADCNCSSHSNQLRLKQLEHILSAFLNQTREMQLDLINSGHLPCCTRVKSSSQILSIHNTFPLPSGCGSSDKETGLACGLDTNKRRSSVSTIAEEEEGVAADQYRNNSLHLKLGPIHQQHDPIQTGTSTFAAKADHWQSSSTESEKMNRSWTKNGLGYVTPEQSRRRTHGVSQKSDTTQRLHSPPFHFFQHSASTSPHLPQNINRILCTSPLTHRKNDTSQDVPSIEGLRTSYSSSSVDKTSNISFTADEARLSNSGPKMFHPFPAQKMVTQTGLRRVSNKDSGHQPHTSDALDTTVLLQPTRSLCPRQWTRTTGSFNTRLKRKKRAGAKVNRKKATLLPIQFFGVSNGSHPMTSNALIASPVHPCDDRNAGVLPFPIPLGVYNAQGNGIPTMGRYTSARRGKKMAAKAEPSNSRGRAFTDMSMVTPAAAEMRDHGKASRLLGKTEPSGTLFHPYEWEFREEATVNLATSRNTEEILAVSITHDLPRKTRPPQCT